MMLITARCTGKPEHVQQMTMNCTREYAELFAGLLDGSSTMYVHPPGPESVIGKCGICRAQIRCVVEEGE
jgi:hypothetical protein